MTSYPRGSGISSPDSGSFSHSTTEPSEKADHRSQPINNDEDYRIIDIPLLDSLSAKVMLPRDMDESKWQVYEAVYNIYIEQYKNKDIGKTKDIVRSDD